MSDYAAFLATKAIVERSTGIEPPALSPKLFDFQADITRWALKRGRACIFADTGMGKTMMQLEWARCIPGDVLIAAPLAVAKQTVRLAHEFGDYDIAYSLDGQRTGQITITNYERLERFKTGRYHGVVLDESGILKGKDRKYRNYIIDSFKDTPFKLACTATPAPNDHMELGSHSEFVGALSYTEMLSMFFVHDGGETQSWRIKGHAEDDFWRWVCSWAVMLRMPSDLGYGDGDFQLPPLNMHSLIVEGEPSEDELFVSEAKTLFERRAARRDTISVRAGIVIETICASWGFDDKLAACGKRNTPIAAANGISQASMSENGERGKADPPRQTENTCADGISNTRSILSPIEKERKSAETHAGATDMCQTPPSGKRLRNPQDEETDEAKRTAGSALNSESQSINMKPSWNGSKEHALSVDELTDACMSTTITHREKFEASCAPNATLDSGSSEITPKESAPQWIIWCDLNGEQEALEKALTKKGVSVSSVYGALSMEEKESRILDWIDRKSIVLLSKPSICGHGLNLQQCSNMAFVGLSDSFEALYQAVRRCWRFGQKSPVDVYVVTSDREGAVVRNIERKERQASAMVNGMLKHMRHINRENVLGMGRQQVSEYKRDKSEGDGWTLHLGDCVEVARGLEDESIDYSIFSPPFASLYTYTDLAQDMGNSRDGEFEKHFEFLVKELYRVIRSGRLVSFHCMNLPTSKTHHGYIGLRDFRGDLIRMFEAVGFIFHSEVVIWKDPVTSMQRTKALGLLHKQVVKDSSMSRQAIPDYLVTMRKPGVNEKLVAGEFDHYAGDDFKSEGRFSIDVWQRYASPVWMDINPSDTLQKASAREEKDERHIAPLQLQVIHRALQIWTAEGDLVFSPFAGIGSEGYESLKLGRRFIGAELKESYWRQACGNLKSVERFVEREAMPLFVEAQ